MPDIASDKRHRVRRSAFPVGREIAGRIGAFVAFGRLLESVVSERVRRRRRVLRTANERVDPKLHITLEPRHEEEERRPWRLWIEVVVVTERLTDHFTRLRV